MPLNPALGDAYRKIVVTTSTGSGGYPGTTTAQAVDAEFNLDAGFGISLVTDIANNKVTIVNTGNGTGALTTITDSDSNGTFYPIFTRSPPVTLTFTAGVDYTTASTPAGITEVRITNVTNSELLAMLTGMIAGETFQGVKVSDSSTLNFTVARAPSPVITGATVTGDGTTATVSYTGPTFAPFFAGQHIAISGFSDVGFNSADVAIISCTKTQLTYLNPTIGTATSGVLTPLHSNSYPAFYDTGLGCWRITVISATGSTETLSSLTISTGAGQINPDTGTYQMDTMYLDRTTTPLSYNPSVGTLTVTDISGVSFTMSGHVTVEGVTSTGSTGTGKFVFDNAPTITGHATIEGQTLTGATGTGKLVLDNAPTITGHATIEGQTLTGVTGTGKLVLDNAPTITGHLTIEGQTLTGVTGTGKLVLDNAPTITGHPTIEGQTLTGATGAGKLVLDNAPTITGHPTIEGQTLTGATGTGKLVLDNAPTITGHPTIEGVTSTGATGTGKFVFDTSPTITSPQILTSALIGPTGSANLTRFPGAVAVVSTVASNQQDESGNIGLIAEAVGTGATRNAGLYGVGYTSGSFSCQGVVGEGHVSATGDTAPSVGVRGYANDAHTGGTNVGLYGDATGSTVANYSLYLNSGDIISASAKTWTLVDNTASALSFDATGKTGILVIKTSDTTEGVTMSGTLSVTGHVTVEGVTSTGATGTGKFVFDNAPTISGHPTIEGVTSTGATGTGKLVFDTSPTIAGGSISGLTTFAIRDTSAAFDVTLAATSSTTLTAGRTLTLDVVNAARTVKLAGNIDIAGTLTTANTFTTSGNFALTLTTTNTTNVTLPTGTVTLYGTGSGTITSSQLATSLSDETGSGVVVFGTNPTLASPSYGNSSSTSDADATVDAAVTTFYAYVQSASTTTRTINISNLTAGRKITLYLRNTNIGAKIVNITASTTTTGFAAVNLATSNGAVSATSVTLSASTGTAVITVFNANGTFGGGM